MMHDPVDSQSFAAATDTPWRRLRQRWLAIGAVLLVVVLIAGAALVTALRSDDDPTLSGTDMGGEPAPGFTLTNQHGESVSLADQRGKVTVLTFLYTHCPDVCPLTAAQLRSVHDRLGEASQHVSMLAVSVDPERDTVEAAYAFSEKFGLEERWSYLVGSRDELEPIWEHYFVGVASESEVGPHDGDHSATEHDSDTRLLHTAPVFLIDADGNLRVIHTTGNDPRSITTNLLHDIQLLIAEISDRAHVPMLGCKPTATPVRAHKLTVRTHITATSMFRRL